MLLSIFGIGVQENRKSLCLAGNQTSTLVSGPVTIPTALSLSNLTKNNSRCGSAVRSHITTDIAFVCLTVTFVSKKTKQLHLQSVPLLACRKELPFTIGTICRTNEESPFDMLKYEIRSSHKGNSTV